MSLGGPVPPGTDDSKSLTGEEDEEEREEEQTVKQKKAKSRPKVCKCTCHGSHIFLC